MANTKISNLSAAGALTGTEPVPIVQGGVTVKTTTQDIANLSGGGGGLTLPTFSITPSWPSWASIIYIDPRPLKINSVTTQISTYSLDKGLDNVFTDYYGVSGGNYITAFSTNAEVIGSNFLAGIFQYADPTLSSISLPTVKAISGFGFNLYGTLFLPTNSNITSISLPNLVACEGLNFISASGLTSLDLSSLSYISNSSNSIYSVNSTLTIPTLSLPSLTTIDGGSINLSEASIGITSVSIPNLQYFGGTQIQITLPSTATTLNFNSLELMPSLQNFTISMPSLTSFGLPALKRINQFGYVSFDFQGCTLDQTSVDNILVTLAALDGTAGTTNWTLGAITITGLNAAPSATGVAAVAVLTGRGISVSTN